MLLAHGPTCEDMERPERCSFSSETICALVPTATKQLCDVLQAGTPRWPLLPEVDVRKLSNVEWASETRQQMNAAYCAKYDITPTIFPALNFDVNLNVRFGDMYWHSAFFGNYLQPSEVQTAPEIHISADPTDDIPEGSLFTLVMFTPDYPFRTSPEDGHLLHWMVCNVPLGSNASFDTVVDYMPPLPTEYAGHFRYLFALFKQDGRLTLPEQSPADHYPLNQRRNFFLHATRPYNTPQDMNIMHVQQSLPAHPTALTFFHCSYDWEVSEYYQTHQLEEPIYTPEDLLQKALMYEKYSEDQRFDAFQRTPDWQKIWPETYRRYEPSEPEKAPDMWERHKGRRKAGLKSRGRKPKRYR